LGALAFRLPCGTPGVMLATWLVMDVGPTWPRSLFADLLMK
jgi:hypothetical protein